MADDRQGFEIDGKFYPYIGIEDWRNSDYVLAYQMTKAVLDDLVEGRDTILYRQALVIVAVHHGQPGVHPDQLVEWLGQMKPLDIKNVGFAEEPADARPPENGSAGGDGSSESSDSSSPTSSERSAATPETSPTTGSSGTRGAPTGAAAP